MGRGGRERFHQCDESLDQNCPGYSEITEATSTPIHLLPCSWAGCCPARWVCLGINVIAKTPIKKTFVATISLQFSLNTLPLLTPEELMVSDFQASHCFHFILEASSEQGAYHPLIMIQSAYAGSSTPLPSHPLNGLISQAHVEEM